MDPPNQTNNIGPAPALAQGNVPLANTAMANHLPFQQNQVQGVFPQNTQAQAHALQTAQALAMLAFPFPSYLAQSQANAYWNGAGQQQAQQPTPSSSRLPNGVPMTGMNGQPQNPSTPVGRSPKDEDLLVNALHASSGKGLSYRQAIESLDGASPWVNNYPAAIWKDFYLENVHRINGLVSILSDGHMKSAKKPASNVASPSSSHQAPGATLASRPLPTSATTQRMGRQTHTGSGSIAGVLNQRRVSYLETQIPSTPSLTPVSRKRTITSQSTSVHPSTTNSKRTSGPVIIPDCPTREPSPPAVIEILAPGRYGNRNAFTAEDKDYFIKFVMWALKCDPTLRKAQICSKLAEKASHHSEGSWFSLFTTIALAEEVYAAGRGRPLRKFHVSDVDDSGVDIKAESELNDDESSGSSEHASSDIDEDGLESTDDDGVMGEAGSSFTATDTRMLSKCISCIPNWGDMLYRDRWFRVHLELPQRTERAWPAYYHRHEKNILKRARKYAKRREKRLAQQQSAQAESSTKRKAHFEDQGDSTPGAKRPKVDGSSALQRWRICGYPAQPPPRAEAESIVIASRYGLTTSAHSFNSTMDEEYDVIVLGTGLTECILSGLLSVEGKKVLHMDRNDYYGGDSASLNLTQLYRKFRNDQAPPTNLGRDRDYAVDLIPKFIIASGELTKILVHTDVTRYLEFKQIAGSYVYRDGRISKVPKPKKFFEFLQGWKDEDPATHQGVDLDKDSMKSIYEKFGLEPGTQDFIGHAMALYLDDEYINKSARPTYERIVLYTSSMARYGKSPYIYPLYGLGELPQSFARLSAIYGGTYMLDKQIDEIVIDADGKFVGVRSGAETV
ncbi:hypothetical protein EW146_g2549, partial [Bondarzewia mesenterica]